mmetsp:Transcript_60571/g.180107  ORF Transcript_60571/g.180107 Transcript_60571/m.180107 type:complete len:225 (+) Transcript_60571:1803-2477(+)
MPPHAGRPPPRHHHCHRHALAVALRPWQARGRLAPQARVSCREAPHPGQQAPGHPPLGQQPRRPPQRLGPAAAKLQDAPRGRASQEGSPRRLPRGAGQPPPAHARLRLQPGGHAHAAGSRRPARPAGGGAALPRGSRGLSRGPRRLAPGHAQVGRHARRPPRRAGPPRQAGVARAQEEARGMRASLPRGHRRIRAALRQVPPHHQLVRQRARARAPRHRAGGRR